ncbi:MAG: anhydro-N-acetylmuramic acid kinase [Pseudomonadota bacterium]
MTNTSYIGCMTGTSVDGLDLAAISVDTNNHIEILHASTFELPAQLRTRLLTLGQSRQCDPDEIGHADAQLGTFIGTTIQAFIQSCKLKAQDISAIGSHGQTIRHRPPPQSDAFTWQIGDPTRIAELTGITTVADFRRRDVAAGGQGAPLVPPFHAALFAQAGKLIAVLNIGGISNISLLGEDIRGFDTGPGNCLLDTWYQAHHSGTYDADGRWAMSGQTDKDLLTALLDDGYFKRAAPKSTGREYFNENWLGGFDLAKHPAADVQATLGALTVRCTLDAIDALPSPPDELILCGGGRHNQHLLSEFRRLAACSVVTCEAKGYDGDAIEAAAFAWFAHLTLTGQPANAPGVTGAEGPRILGAIFPA